MCTSFSYLTNILLIVIAYNAIVQANDLESNAGQNLLPFSVTPIDLSFAKEIISNNIILIQLQSTLVIMASERDFSFNVSSNSALNYIHYPNSYRTTLVEFSSTLYKTFTNMYSTIYRLELDVNRIPGHIKTILRVLTKGTPTMIKQMIPISLNNIARISDENKISVDNIISQLNSLNEFLNEIIRYKKDIVFNIDYRPSSRTDVVLYNELNSNIIFEKLYSIIQQLKDQFQQISKLIIDLNIKSHTDLFITQPIIYSLPILYALESSAYVIHQMSNIYANMLNRYIINRLAEVTQYALLSSDDERFTSFSKLSEDLTNLLHEIDQMFGERQTNFTVNIAILQKQYQELFYDFQNSPSKP